jgi:hypothetical protein
MFSLEKFYHILHDNFINRFKNGKSFYFFPFGKTDIFTALLCDEVNSDRVLFKEDVTQCQLPFHQRYYVHCFFIDQEPVYDFNIIPFLDNYTEESHRTKLHIIANSEKSEIVEQFFRKHKNFYSWYYFFHGFAALDWYRDFQYLNPKSFDYFDKVFISHNHLISKKRSYRLHLVSNFINRKLDKHGYVSLFLKDIHGTWLNEITNTECLLDKRAKVQVYNALKNLSGPLIIDTDDPNGEMSAKVDHKELTKALWHVVSETIFFDRKLHLTEKIFKPISVKRPFILVAAPGNLAYLKRYGFKTFDRWIDESYDSEQDDYLRIEKITNEVDKLCKLSPEELKTMHQEMKEILEYNYQHFYGEFKKIIVHELVENFEGVLMQFNNGRMPNNHSRYHERFELPKEYFEEVKRRLLL